MHSTCKNADSFNLTSKSLIQKLEAGPRNLHFDLVSLIILMRIRSTVPLLLRRTSSFSLTFFPLQTSQSMNYLLS
uniref:Uncharacterized protein n=1 Tax=Cebus imitator TaxID=2715852 RepID=A0A2K5QNW9_CEBIM